MKKPSIKAFGAGSVVVIQFKEDTVITVPDALFVGERNAEGYGEMEVLKLDRNASVGRAPIEDKEYSNSQSVLNVSELQLAKDICDDKLSAYIREKAVQKADAFFRSPSWRPVVANMLLMYEENLTIAAIRSVVESRFGKSLQSKQNKKDKAERILKEAEMCSVSILEDFCRDYGIEGYEKDIEWTQMAFLKEFLTHGKYRIRQTVQGKEDSNE